MLQKCDQGIISALICISNILMAAIKHSKYPLFLSLPCRASDGLHFIENYMGRNDDHDSSIGSDDDSSETLVEADVDSAETLAAGNNNGDGVVDNECVCNFNADEEKAKLAKSDIQYMHQRAYPSTGILIDIFTLYEKEHSEYLCNGIKLDRPKGDYHCCVCNLKIQLNDRNIYRYRGCPDFILHDSILAVKTPCFYGDLIHIHCLLKMGRIHKGCYYFKNIHRYSCVCCQNRYDYDELVKYIRIGVVRAMHESLLLPMETDLLARVLYDLLEHNYCEMLLAELGFKLWELERFKKCIGVWRDALKRHIELYRKGNSTYDFSFEWNLASENKHFTAYHRKMSLLTITKLLAADDDAEKIVTDRCSGLEMILDVNLAFDRLLDAIEDTEEHMRMHAEVNGGGHKHNAIPRTDDYLNYAEIYRALASISSFDHICTMVPKIIEQINARASRLKPSDIVQMHIMLCNKIIKHAPVFSDYVLKFLHHSKLKYTAVGYTSFANYIRFSLKNDYLTSECWRRQLSS